VLEDLAVASDHVADFGVSDVKDRGLSGGDAVSVLADQELLVGVVDGPVHGARVLPDLYLAPVIMTASLLMRMLDRMEQRIESAEPRQTLAAE
jgi:hypothetical protein